MGRGIGGHQRAYEGKTDEWLTPPEIIQALGIFDLDPCAPITRPWEMATNHFTVNDDGLKQPWQGRIWLNPPYGPETGKWLSRLAVHGNGIALVFARTETQMFHEHVWRKADSVFFFYGRLYFYDVYGKKAAHNSGGPSALVAYGTNNTDSLRSSEIGDGILIELKNQYCMNKGF